MTAASVFQHEGGEVLVSAAGPVDHEVRVPGSKSLTNRFLLLSALAEGPCRLCNPLQSEDTAYMLAALDKLGVAVDQREGVWIVQPPQAWRDPGEALFVGNAGTAMRFLAPALALQSFESTLTGNARMLARPIGDLVEGLRQLGVQVRYKGRTGYPPLRLRGPMRPGPVTIKGDSSSQYLSGLLMALPRAKGNARIRISGELVSHTYVAMTLDCLARFGVRVAHRPDLRELRIEGSRSYRPGTVHVESDASTASYWFALALMVGGAIRVENVPETSCQGDFGLLSILRDMGAEVTRERAGVTVRAAPLHGVDVDMNSMSDVAPTLAVVATRADSPTTIRNIGNMRIKECDRIATLQRAFDDLGLKMESGEDWMRIHSSPRARAATLDPEEDHRMAMVFTLLGLAHGDVRIRDADCVAKTYPGFFADMDAVLSRKESS